MLNDEIIIIIIVNVWLYVYVNDYFSKYTQTHTHTAQIIFKNDLILNLKKILKISFPLEYTFKFFFVPGKKNRWQNENSASIYWSIANFFLLLGLVTRIYTSWLHLITFIYIFFLFLFRIFFLSSSSYITMIEMINHFQVSFFFFFFYQLNFLLHSFCKMDIQSINIIITIYYIYIWL